MAKSKTAVLVGDLTRSIFVLRGHKILLDEDLAALYGVVTGVLVQAVKRNIARFPVDFMFLLTAAVDRFEITNCDSKVQPAKLGPAPKLRQQIERIQRLPRAKQRFVIEMLDTVLAQASR